jgi:WD40 repeat protein
MLHEPKLLRNASSSVVLLACLVLPTRLGAGGETTAADRPLGISSVAFSPDGALLAAGLGEPKQRGKVVLWELAGRKQLWTHTEDRGVVSVAFAPDAKTMAIAVYDYAAKIVDTRTGKALRVLRGNKSHARAVAFSPDGKTLASGGWDNVKLWDLATGMEKKTLACPSSSHPFSLSYSPSGKWLMAAAYQATVWDSLTGEEARAVQQNFPLRGCAVFADDNSFFTGGYDRNIRLWDIAGGKQRLRFQGTGNFDRLAYSSKARMLAAFFFPRNLSVFEFGFDAPAPAQAERSALYC